MVHVPVRASSTNAGSVSLASCACLHLLNPNSSLITTDFTITVEWMKYALYISITLLWVFAVTPQVQAHNLTVDQSIGAVLHIDPGDDPIVNQPAYFFFEIKDKTGKFDFKNCVCIVTITVSENPLFSQTLDSTSGYPSLAYTFPEKNSYTVTLSGTPKQPGLFQPFTLTYPVQVAHTASTSLPLSRRATYSIILVGTLTLVGTGLLAFRIRFREQ